MTTPIRHVTAGILDVAYHEAGRPDGTPVICLHGFPYDAHAFDEVAALLPNHRVIIPYLRGYGPTRFLSPDTLRSGEQAALAADLLSLLDALDIPSAILAGYDWGGRAACIVAALHPERTRGLVTCGGYLIQDIASAGGPQPPEAEHLLWYQYYFHTDRGRAGLTQNRQALTRYLWRLWSPTWRFTDAIFAQTAAAFDNPDFVDICIHSYRHRFGHVPGDPAYQRIEHELSRQPAITIPAITLHGADDGVSPPKSSEAHAHHFTASYQRRLLPGIGHNIPQEAPQAFAAAIHAVSDG